MKEMPKGGTMIRFRYGGKDMVGYATGYSEKDMIRVCTKPGTYYWVDRCLAEAV